MTHDPLFVVWGGVGLSIDLRAEKLIEAERDGQQIPGEINF
jgi:hypothetical protein